MESFELSDVSVDRRDESPQRSSVHSETSRSAAALEHDVTEEEAATVTGRHESSLGRVDGGFQAWSLVCLLLLRLDIVRVLRLQLADY